MRRKYAKKNTTTRSGKLRMGFSHIWHTQERQKIRTVGDFRLLNAMLVRTPCIIEPLHKLLYYIGHFTWALDLFLPMAHSTMSSCKESIFFMKLVTIFGIYECQALWMGVYPASDIVQVKIDFVLQHVLPKPPKTHEDEMLSAVF